MRQYYRKKSNVSPRRAIVYLPATQPIKQRSYRHTPRSTCASCSRQSTRKRWVPTQTPYRVRRLGRRRGYRAGRKAYETAYPKQGANNVAPPKSEVNQTANKRSRDDRESNGFQLALKATKHIEEDNIDFDEDLGGRRIYI